MPEMKKAAIEPIRFAFRSKSAQTSCGNSRTNTRSLVKNHSACTLCTFSAMSRAPAPRNAMETRTSVFMAPVDRSGHRRRLQQFQLNMEAAERMEELKLEVTAPTIASSPSSATQAGAACFRNSGNVSEGYAANLAATAGGQG